VEVFPGNAISARQAEELQEEGFEKWEVELRHHGRGAEMLLLFWEMALAQLAQRSHSTLLRILVHMNDQTCQCLNLTF
jgi:hypothetical protein